MRSERVFRLATAPRNVFKITAAGTISVFCTGWFPGYGRLPRSSRVCHIVDATAPVTSIRPPSRVWLSTSCTPRPPGGGVGVRQKRRCCHCVTGRASAQGADAPMPWPTGAPWQYSEPTAVATDCNSGRSRRSTGTTACSSIPAWVNVSTTECATTGCADTSRNSRWPSSAAARHRLREAHPITQIGHPVVLVARRGRARISQCRCIQRNLGGTRRRQRAGESAEFSGQRVHRRAVKRHVGVDPADHHAFVGPDLADCVDGADGAGHHRRCG